ISAILAKYRLSQYTWNFDEFVILAKRTFPNQPSDSPHTLLFHYFLGVFSATAIIYGRSTSHDI
ncbi:MAG: hypothetical protein P8X80_09130, partial [Desulfobacterales bacterium]